MSFALFLGGKCQSHVSKAEVKLISLTMSFPTNARLVHFEYKPNIGVPWDSHERFVLALYYSTFYYVTKSRRHRTLSCRIPRDPRLRNLRFGLIRFRKSFDFLTLLVRAYVSIRRRSNIYTVQTWNQTLLSLLDSCR